LRKGGPAVAEGALAGPSPLLGSVPLAGSCPSHSVSAGRKRLEEGWDPARRTFRRVGQVTSPLPSPVATGRRTGRSFVRPARLIGAAEGPPTSSLPSPGSPARARVQSSAPGCRAIGMFRCTAGRASTRPRTRAGRKPGSTRPRRVGLVPLRDRPRSGRSSRAPCGSRTRIPRSGARRDTKPAGVKVLAQYSSSSTPYVVRAYTTIRLSVMSRMLASG
jgi:hypothetical protein